MYFVSLGLATGLGAKYLVSIAASVPLESVVLSALGAAAGFAGMALAALPFSGLLASNIGILD